MCRDWCITIGSTGAAGGVGFKIKAGCRGPVNRGVMQQVYLKEHTEYDQDPFH